VLSRALPRNGAWRWMSTRPCEIREIETKQRGDRDEEGLPERDEASGALKLSPGVEEVNMSAGESAVSGRAQSFGKLQIRS